MSKRKAQGHCGSCVPSEAGSPDPPPAGAEHGAGIIPGHSWYLPPLKKNQINKLKVRKFSCALIQITKRNLLHVLPFYLSLSSKHDFHSGGSLCSTPTRQSQHT